MSIFHSKPQARAHFRRLRPLVGLSRAGSAVVEDFISQQFPSAASLLNPGSAFSSSGFRGDSSSLEQLRVGSFHPLSGELDIRDFNATFPGELFFPVFDPRLRVSQDPVFAGADGALVAPEQLVLDMILVPALALEPSGARLGQGGGWYDRALAGLLLANPSLVKVGCVPSDFLVAAQSLPVEAHDVPLDWVLTEAGFSPVS